MTNFRWIAWRWLTWSRTDVYVFPLQSGFACGIVILFLMAMITLYTAYRVLNSPEGICKSVYVHMLAEWTCLMINHQLLTYMINLLPTIHDHF